MAPKGLIVSRYAPPPSASALAGKKRVTQEVGGPLPKQGRVGAEPEPRGDSPRREPLERSVKVKPGFASFFKQSLDKAPPPGEDEKQPAGVEPSSKPAQPDSEPATTQGSTSVAASGLPWLTSLSGQAPAEATPPTQPDPEPATQQGGEGAAVDGASWLRSLTGPAPVLAPLLPKGDGDESSTGQASLPRLSKAARSWVGKALPVAPFWRTRTVAEVEREHYEEKEEILDRVKKIARDAKRMEQKRRRPKLE